MKKSILLMLMSFVLSINSIKAQNLSNTKDLEETTHAIEQTVQYYIKVNLDKELPKEMLKKLENNSEFTTKQAIEDYKLQMKKRYLKEQFFKMNPSLRIGVRPVITETPCEDDNEEGTFENSALLSNYTATSNSGDYMQSDINNMLSNPSLNDDLLPFSLVSSGNDVMLQTLFPAGGDTNGVILPRTNGGSRAIRINQNLGHFGNGLDDNAELDVLKKTFEAKGATISLDYAAVFETWSNHDGLPHEEAYFKATVRHATTLAILDSRLIRASDTDEELIDLGYVSAHGNILYSNWRTITLDIGENNVGENVILELEVRDCVDRVHAGYVYVDNISNCGDDDPSDCQNPCNINADFSINNVSKCVKTFNGTNAASPACNDLYSYLWTITKNGNTIATSTDQNFTFDFSNSEDGFYKVRLGIGYRGESQKCFDNVEKTVYIDCQPNCKPASCLRIDAPAVFCGEVMAWMNCNDPEIDYIEWFYTIGSYIHVSTGFSGGNAAGQHSRAIDLPPAPNGTWEGYILRVYAKIVFKNGTVCDEISTAIEMPSCISGANGRMQLYPNPSKSNSEIQIEGIDIKNIKSVEIFDFYGNRKMKQTLKTNKISTANLPSGMYFVNFHTVDGIKQKKLIIE